MRRPYAPIVVLVILLIASIWLFGSMVSPYPAGGWWGMMGPRAAGPGVSMGPGMMGGPLWSGYGSGVMRPFGPDDGPAWSGGWRDLNLSADNVKTQLERWLAWAGNARLKLGEVKEKDADTIVADIVTKDNSLVQRFVVNRHSGYFRPSED